MTKRAHPYLSEAPIPDLFSGSGVLPAGLIPKTPTKRPTLDKPTGERDHRLRHRGRLRERFMVGGAAAMPDYELLELLLFGALPRVDTKPLAKRLLTTFGDLNRVLAAPPAQLAEVEGVGKAVIEQLKIIESVGHRMARAKVIQRPVLSSWDALLDYLKAAMAHQQVEQFRVLYLDRKNVLIRDECLGEGTVDHVPVYPREVMKRALEVGASALILVHNHPSGDPTPSQADVDMTFAIRDAAEIFGIVLHDHLIIGKARETSFRSEGLI